MSPKSWGNPPRAPSSRISLGPPQRVELISAVGWVIQSISGELALGALALVGAGGVFTGRGFAALSEFWLVGVRVGGKAASSGN